eukprot:CAMPEP_0117524854 /NCGR_PEP_ID=MMETSP0784-20121206/35465_1 /TAXON_ID=39447 /ORGANISM="" /LENGTH=167 /DNA_ID=CAMNT_0005321025 /DNA_START=84 /DNA_END=584 /DNA_ORIENTATION=-
MSPNAHLQVHPATSTGSAANGGTIRCVRTPANYPALHSSSKPWSCFAPSALHKYARLEEPMQKGSVHIVHFFTKRLVAILRTSPLAFRNPRGRPRELVYEDAMKPPPEERPRGVREHAGAMQHSSRDDGVAPKRNDALVGSFTNSPADYATPKFNKKALAGTGERAR